jgi:hypothetical protein
MALRIADKNKKLITFRQTPSGAVLTKGKRELYLTYKSVNQGKKAREIISKNSFNKLFTKGKKVRQLGSNVSHIVIK